MKICRTYEKIDKMQMLGYEISWIIRDAAKTYYAYIFPEKKYRSSLRDCFTVSL